ncbi:MAG: phenylalanine--tRNA ligase subunit beta, partial [Janthinobacterium lividum]
MKIFTPWLRSFLPPLDADDQELAEALTLRGIAVEGIEEHNDVSGGSDGALFEMDITTNRVDAMNHYGVAREAAAIYSVPLHTLDTRLPEPTGTETWPVRIDAPDLCGRFTARILRDVHVGASTGLTESRFHALGFKLISNAVDATNLTLHGMGHPTHAFDLDKVQGAIVVRRAHPGESLRLLDGTTRTLVADDLVVADEAKALGLAGVMGGWDSMITSETRNILVEAAWFSPAAIRASSRRHGIHTDASHRFERGADFAAAPLANALVCREILASCGGHLAGPLVDVVMEELQLAMEGRPAITLSLAEVHRHLGQTVAPEGITSALVERFLSALGCRLTLSESATWQVQLPSWRLDLTREIDLIEEIARVYGYNGFANTLPTPAAVVAHPTAAAERAVRTRLLALGLSEALSSTFNSAAESAEFSPTLTPVALENPLNEQAAHLRPSLLPGMVEMLAQNLTRDVLSVRLFESGAVFRQDAALAHLRGGEVHETHSLAMGMTGPSPESKLAVAQDAPFFELKGIVEAMLKLFTDDRPAWSASDAPGFQAGRTASVSIGDKRIGIVGQYAAPPLRKLRQPLWLAELDLEALLVMPLRRSIAREISRFQA